MTETSSSGIFAIVSVVLLSYGTLVQADSLENISDSKTNSTAEVMIFKKQKPVIQLYYEILCPYSRDFVVQEFIPTMVKLKDHLHFELIPYGHAVTIPVEVEGQRLFTFTCQHGRIECEGNMIHACAISKNFENNNKAHLLGFIGCTMLNSFPDTTSYPQKLLNNPGKIGENCAKEFDLNWTEIHTCWKGEEGVQVLKKMGEKTGSLSPTMEFVPLVVFNGSQNGQIHLRNNLLSHLCMQMHGTDTCVE